MNETSPENQTPAAFVRPTPNTIAQRDRIVHTISQNQEVADITVLREIVLKSIAERNEKVVPFPVALQIQKRTERLRPLCFFFSEDT
jgi:hypothetical protein